MTSYNVVGAVEGSDPDVADEYIVFMAHWDHFGVGESVDGDSIYNGANDNAAGVASMLEVAEAWRLAQPAPRRSALFIATTAEEAGLLGATHYVNNPPVPLAKTLAVINIDGVNVWGPTEDLSVTGLGNSTLDDDLTAVLAGQGRTLTPDPEPEKGYYFRADHFPFAQAGIPAVSPWSGEKFVGKPEDFAQRVWEEYDANHYHQPSDEFDPSWDFSGNVHDMEALLQVGLRISSAPTPGPSGTPAASSRPPERPCCTARCHELEQATERHQSGSSRRSKQTTEPPRATLNISLRVTAST